MAENEPARAIPRLTKREYFAAAALACVPPMVTHGRATTAGELLDECDNRARRAVMMADALIRALEGK